MLPLIYLRFSMLVHCGIFQNFAPASLGGDQQVNSMVRGGTVYVRFNMNQVRNIGFGES
jgi:hypothetical protein